MLTYRPVDVGVAFDCADADLLSIDWQKGTAEFTLPEHGQILEVFLGTDVILRVLDEMPLSTEADPSTWDGLVPHHFAYRVEGSTFAETQSAAWKESGGRVFHYRFVTGYGCLDVLTRFEPRFRLRT